MTATHLHTISRTIAPTDTNYHTRPLTTAPHDGLKARKDRHESVKLVNDMMRTVPISGNRNYFRDSKAISAETQQNTRAG